MISEGINMGRKSPWTKEYLISLYHKVDDYCKFATLQALKTDGPKAASETMTAYNLFKYPVVYIFIHYHFGNFNDLEMTEGDIQIYLMMYLSEVKHFTRGMREGMMEENIFGFDSKNEIGPALIQICKEVLYIEENF